MMQGISSLDHLPMDITLQLSDGNIKANKMMLGIVSPVFKKMLYGSFKEASSSEVDLPKDNYKIMKLLFDIVFEGSSELESLDDIIPLMEVVDRYEIKKVPMQRMCDEAILAELDPSNYVNMLQKFASVMSEAGIEEAAHGVMCYCDSDFATKFKKTKNLPEEVLLCLLQRNDVYNPEIELFTFLEKWHDYQTKELKKELNLVPKLFQSIRYFLISPRLLLNMVDGCSYVDKQVMMEALDNLYTKPLNERQCCEGNERNNSHKLKAPRHFRTIEWNFYNDPKPSMMYRGNICHVQYYNTKKPDGGRILYSKPLKNGTYSINISECWRNLSLSICACATAECLYEIPVNRATGGIAAILFVYEGDLFLKVLEGCKVRTTHSATTQNTFHIQINTNATEITFQITQTT